MDSILSGMTDAMRLDEALERALAAMPEVTAGAVDCIDSSHGVEGVPACLKHHGIRFETRGQAVIVQRGELLRAIEERVFTGFDSVWLFSALPGEVASALPTVTSDGTGFQPCAPSSVLNAMRTLNCRLVLGDGCGLNWATPEPRIAAIFGDHPSSA